MIQRTITSTPVHISINTGNFLKLTKFELSESVIVTSGVAVFSATEFETNKPYTHWLINTTGIRPSIIDSNWSDSEAITYETPL